MTIANTAEPTIPTSINELRLRRAESDPGVLRRVSADKWLGDVPVYLFLERGEERLRLVGTAHVTVTGSIALTAHISVAYPELEANKADEPKHMALWQDASGGYRFSLSETIELKR
jgi:hypothetical protein